MRTKPRRLKAITVFLVEDAAGNEGVASFPSRGRTDQYGRAVVELVPMIASTDERLEQLRAVAGDLVAGQRMRIVRFRSRVDLEELS